MPMWIFDSKKMLCCGFAGGRRMKFKRKIDEAVAGRLRKVISHFDKDAMRPIPEDQKVEVARMKVRKKEEFAILKASLEKKGYHLTCKEFSDEDGDGWNYSAMILGEKRIQLEENEIPAPIDPKKERGKKRIVTMGVKAMWWIVIILFLWVWFLTLNRPINSAIKAILEYWRG